MVVRFDDDDGDDVDAGVDVWVAAPCAWDLAPPLLEVFLRGTDVRREVVDGMVLYEIKVD